MMTPQQKLDLLVKGYKSLSNVQWKQRTVSGLLPPLDESVFSLLSELHEAELLEITAKLDCISILVSDINCVSYLGAIFEIELTILQGPHALFVKSFPNLLKLYDTLYKKPTAFFIDEPRYYSEDTCNPPDIINKYYYTLSFIKVLTNIADFVDEADPRYLRLIYLLKEKCEIRIDYDATDVELTSTSDVLIDFTQTGPHEINKRDILKGVIIDVLRNSDTTFKTILRSINEISRRATDNYAVFVSEFSFDKIRDEIEKRKTEFILRINKTFSDIQDKLLGIPVALIVASTQIDIKNSYTKNTAIMFGISIFTILMSCLIQNQLHNLKVIKDEYAYQEDMLENEYSTLHDKIASAFKAIKLRWRYLNRTFYGVAVILFINYIVTYYLYFQWTLKFKAAVNCLRVFF